MQFIGPGRQVCVDIVVDLSEAPGHQAPGRIEEQVDVVTQGPSRRHLILQLVIEPPEQRRNRFTGQPRRLPREPLPPPARHRLSPAPSPFPG